MHEKERENAANDEWHDRSVKNAVVCLGGSVETVALEMRRVSATEDGGCA